MKTLAEQALAKTLHHRMEEVVKHLNNAVGNINLAGFAFAQLNPNDDAGFAEFIETFNNLNDEMKAIESWATELKREHA